MNESLSGNYGLQDVLQALRWISANIRQFGGDPDKVMLVIICMRCICLTFQSVMGV